MVGLHRAAVRLGPSCTVAEILVWTTSVGGLPGAAGGPDPDCSTTRGRVLHALQGRGKCTDAWPEKGTSVPQRQIGLKLHRLQRYPPSGDWFRGAGGARAPGDQPLCRAPWFSPAAGSLPVSDGATCVSCRARAGAAGRPADATGFWPGPGEATVRAPTSTLRGNSAVANSSNPGSAALLRPRLRFPSPALCAQAQAAHAVPLFFLALPQYVDPGCAVWCPGPTAFSRCKMLTI